MATPVGILNNNPGNIWNAPGVQFTGEVTAPGATWKKFLSMAYGYRALMKNLQAYIAQGIDTLPKITAKWAPAGHGSNNPTKYALDISNMTGVQQGAKISPSDYDSLMKISAAIGLIEQGVQPNMADVQEGARLLMAGGTAPTEPKAEPITTITIKPAHLIIGGAALILTIYALTNKKKAKAR
jgi:hypothetical protein